MRRHHVSRTQTSTGEQLVSLGASLFARSLTFGRTGNLSALDEDGTVLLTPTGISLGELDVDALSRIDSTGQHIGGLPPTKEAFLHLAMYRARPSARAVVHTHSTYSVAVSCMRDTNRDNAIPPLTAYYAMRVGTLPLLPYHAPGDQALGPLAELMAGDHHALLLANHGPIVAAGDLASAADALEELEETAKLHLLLQGHPTSPVPDTEVARLRDLYR
jgi:3-dehydro-4-phosphotetronate decarboxylase